MGSSVILSLTSCDRPTNQLFIQEVVHTKENLPPRSIQALVAGGYDGPVDQDERTKLKMHGKNVGTSNIE